MRLVNTDRKQGSNRGVVWDQEIYDPFHYNQDRTFFHSFELEDCLAGLSFVDEKEAKQFKKKMDDREKNASKQTKATPFQGSTAQSTGAPLPNGKSHHRFGLGNLLHGQRSSSAPQVPPQQPQTVIPPREISQPEQAPSSPTREKTSSLDTVDPSWRGILGELLEMGITEDQIEQHSDFIKDYIEQRKASGNAVGSANASTTNGINEDRRAKAPPPPPPPGALPTRLEAISPQGTGNPASSKRGPAPAVPPSRRSRPDSQSTTSSHQDRSPERSPARTPSPPRPAYQFRAPPPLTDAGKFAHVPAPSLPTRMRATSNVTNSGPPPPPRPPKTPMEDEDEVRPKFGVPPPFQGERKSSIAPPPPPSRAPLQSSPRNGRDANERKAVPPSSAAPPPLPPKAPSAQPPSSGPPPPPPLPAERNTAVTPPPPPLPATPRPVTSIPHTSGPPPPPPLPSSSAPPPPSLPSSSAPPPPPMPSSGGPPPPPLPPGRGGFAAPSLPQPVGGKDDLLASIRGSGGIGGGRLKRVSSQEKRDRSAATVPGATPAGVSGGGAPPAPSGGGGLGDALAAALSQRNKKVSASGKVLFTVTPVLFLLTPDPCR